MKMGLVRATLIVLCSYAVGTMPALGFAGYVVPARFELKATPGQVSRQVLTIGNDAAAGDEFSIKTAEWQLSQTGAVAFSTETPGEGSCRHWVQIERHTVKLAARGSRRYRFEVHVPSDAKPQECRFAILIERAQDVLPTVIAGNIQLPLSGRIGVIVYVAIGDVAPKLTVDAIRMGRVNGVLTPVVDVHNTGMAHGRFEGVLEGTDATGKKFEFTVSNLPILAGEKRTILITPHDSADGKRPDWKPPLTLRGDLEWTGGKWPVNVVLSAL